MKGSSVIIIMKVCTHQLCTINGRHQHHTNYGHWYFSLISCFLSSSMRVGIGHAQNKKKKKKKKKQSQSVAGCCWPERTRATYFAVYFTCPKINEVIIIIHCVIAGEFCKIQHYCTL